MKLRCIVGVLLMVAGVVDFVVIAVAAPFIRNSLITFYTSRGISQYDAETNAVALGLLITAAQAFAFAGGLALVLFSKRSKP